MVKAKSKSSVKKQNAASNKEAQQTAMQLRDLKKSFKSQLTSLKSEFNNKLKAVTANAFQKALADFEREATKRTQAKVKLLREATVNFEKNFPSKFADFAPVKTAKKTSKPKAKTTRGRSAKKA